MAGDDPIPVKFEHKGTDSQYEECAFHVSHAARYAVRDSRLLVDALLQFETTATQRRKRSKSR